MCDGICLAVVVDKGKENGKKRTGGKRKAKVDERDDGNKVLLF